MKKITMKRTIAGLALFVFITSIVNAQGSLFVDFYFGESFSWKIDNISTSTNSWYNVSTFVLVTNWHANKNDTITFSVDSSREISNELHLFGNLSLGNITLLTNNKDIGFNLGLSASPWYGGLVALVNDWNELLNTPPFNITNAEVDIDKKITMLGQEVEVIEINYDDGFQKTTLQYEKLTGLLMYANTSIGNFWLEFHLTSSTIPIPSPTKTIAITKELFFVAIIFITLINIKSAKRKKRIV